MFDNKIFLQEQAAHWRSVRLAARKAAWEAAERAEGLAWRNWRAASTASLCAATCGAEWRAYLSASEARQAAWKGYYREICRPQRFVITSF